MSTIPIELRPFAMSSTFPARTSTLSNTEHEFVRTQPLNCAAAAVARVAVGWAALDEVLLAAGFDAEQAASHSTVTTISVRPNAGAENRGSTTRTQRRYQAPTAAVADTHIPGSRPRDYALLPLSKRGIAESRTFASSDDPAVDRITIGPDAAPVRRVLAPDRRT
jgi:hypothetical protein